MDEEKSEDSNVSTFYSPTFYECRGEAKSIELLSTVSYAYSKPRYSELPVIMNSLSEHIVL